jgi:hypothetical protein
MLEFLLGDEPARERLERLAAACAATRREEPLTAGLSAFIREIAERREGLRAMMRARQDASRSTPPRLSADLQAAAASLGLAHVPGNAYERLAGILGQDQG